MLNFTTNLALSISLAVALSNSQLIAQDVILSETYPDGGWIELHNRGTDAADLTNWSVYLATDTANMPGTYWWGFPSGTTIAAGDFLRVHWFAPRQTNTQHDLYTGDTTFWFLFGLGGEALPGQRGALGLLRSRSNSEMSNPAMFVDWVSWGQGGMAREDVAEQAGIWVQGRAAPAIPTGSSLARNAGTNTPSTPEQMWFVDSTPTPLAANTSIATITPIGAPCTALGHRLLGAPELVAESSPIIGNSGFRLAVTNTTGLLFETCVVGFALQPSPASSPNLLPEVPGSLECRQWIDPTTMLSMFWLPTVPGRTEIPFSLATAPTALSGLQFHVQALVFDNWAQSWPLYQGATNGLTIVLGM